MIYQFLQGILIMFRSYIEGVRDPSCKALPQETSTGEAVEAWLGDGRKKSVTKDFDKYFKHHGGRLPVPFLRALAKRESNMNPRESKASFWGILQVGWRGKNSVIKGYNERFDTDYTKFDLLDPYINIMIASELINRIARNYQDLSKENPSLMRNMVIDFSNPEFVKLLLAGWNSGYSRAAGVQKVARYLAKRGILVTHDVVFANAVKAGATKFLRASVPGEPGEHARLKQRWQRGVSALYFRMLRDEPGAQVRKPAPSETMAGPIILTLSLLTLLAVK